MEFSGRQTIFNPMGESLRQLDHRHPFFDEHVLGLGATRQYRPDIVNNKGRNAYFMLPLLLGIIGIFYQLRLKTKGQQSFLVVFMLFFMTGLAIILYLNQTPYEPRERDYAYAGSFYAFSIWVGMGVAGISLFLRKYIKNTTAATALATVASLFVPIQMASQNWDDHDRSGRTLARDTGMNYLIGVGQNGILSPMAITTPTRSGTFKRPKGSVPMFGSPTSASYKRNGTLISYCARPTSRAPPIEWSRTEYPRSRQRCLHRHPTRDRGGTSSKQHPAHLLRKLF